MVKATLVLVSLWLLGSSGYAQAAHWPPETGAKVAGNALEFPSKLQGVNTSLEDLLNNGAQVIASSLGSDGPIITVKSKKQVIICLLKGAGIGSDQKVATSKCYALN